MAARPLFWQLKPRALVMKSNVGNTDAVIRGIIAIAGFALAVIFNSSPIPSLVFAFIGLVMAGTALTRSCPLYTLLGFDTGHRRPVAPRS